ncbi:MAG: nucleotidyl transferase AbiEii/AbiGii toxin family protein [Spirochaetota bacterium]
MDYFSRFMEILEALEKEKVEYILIGGFAIILYGLPRLTEDIDLFIKQDDNNISRLKHALLSVFADESINEINPEMLKEYPVIRYGSPDGFYIDILCSLGEAFKYDDLEYTEKVINGLRVRIASAETLYAMKKDTVRPIDKEDSIFLQNIIKQKNEEK